MEGKTVISILLLVSIVVGELQVEAGKSCCPNNQARTDYDWCIYNGRGGEIQCSLNSGCLIVDNGARCPGLYPALANTGDTIYNYCKLGCGISVCGAMVTLQNTGAGEKCNNVCSAICAKSSIARVETV